MHLCKAMPRLSLVVLVLSAVSATRGSTLPLEQAKQLCTGAVDESPAWCFTRAAAAFTDAPGRAAVRRRDLARAREVRAATRAVRYKSLMLCDYK
jgi:hypothetical protein